MLEKLIGKINLIVSERRRARRSHALRLYCVKKEFNFYPELLGELPLVAAEVNKYIATKAQADLPAVQFKGMVSLTNRDELVEIDGVLGYKDRLFEICYNPPNRSNVNITDNSDSLEIRSSGSPLVIPADVFRNTNLLVFWHTHPVYTDGVCDGDVNGMNGVLEIFRDKPVYFVVFTPARYDFDWYQVCKAQPKQ